MTGTMGLTLPAFLIAWTVMMAAMMLPSVAPVASMYARSISGRRALRLTLFTSGYLIVWASAGVVAFGLGALIAGLAEGDPRLGTAAGVAAYLACGLYQLSPLKYRCLSHCRSPLSLFLHYSSYQGPLRDLRVGAHHGAYCLGCCWGLMVVLLALGAMSVVPMLILAAVVITEKLWSRGEAFSRVVPGPGRRDHLAPGTGARIHPEHAQHVGRSSFRDVRASTRREAPLPGAWPGTPRRPCTSAR
jgi:predicted metal-binding membrane protein